MNEGEEVQMAKRYESDRTRKEKMEMEREKLSQMKFSEKLEYIWTYYKPVIFGIIAVIVLIFIVRNQIENAKYYDILSIGVANSGNMDLRDSLQEQLLEQFGDPDDKYQRVSIDTSYVFGSDIENGDYNTIMKFAAVTAAKELDILICNENVYEHYNNQEYFMDLTDLFTEEECQKYNISEGDTAIEITDLPKYKEMNLTSYEPVYLAVLVNAQNLDTTKDFINYLEEDN